MISCDSTDPKPPDNNPPGYQEDIPWPSLADSPWPIYRADAQNTGRSKFIGPQIGSIDTIINAYNLQATAVLNENSNLIFVSSSPAVVHSFNLMNYEDRIDTIGFDNHTTPVVNNKNSIYVTSDLFLNKYDSTGSLLWSYTLNKGILSASLVIDKAGNIYFVGDDYTLNSISEDGNINWVFSESRLFKNTYHAPAFSPDGKTLYLQGESVSLLAFDIETQNIKWEFGNNRLASGPILDSQGNIYITPSTNNNAYLILYSLTSSGEIRWEAKLYAGDYTSEEPTIDKFGNVIVGLNDTLYSIDYSGNINWKAFLGLGQAASSVISDRDGNIFFTLENPTSITAFNNTGIQMWNVVVENERLLYPPLITAESRLIIPSFRSNSIYLIK
jgi:outer membrane protein assembly factor BamB